MTEQEIRDDERAKVIEEVLALEEEHDGGFGDMFDSIWPDDVRALHTPASRAISEGEQ